MAQPDISQCKNCNFWKSIPDIKRSNVRGLVGMCRKSAPVLYGNESLDCINYWPLTTEDAWCGDWQVVK